ncbi:MAG: hypothetical protein IT370_05030 [Deltaproteobacteria bacterium]|nr:hypothetical protein [Deltaproteobacteria bacterium]
MKLTVAIGALAAAAVIVVLILLYRGSARKKASGQAGVGAEVTGPGGPGAGRSPAPRPVLPKTRVDTTKVSEHATGIDRRMAQIIAMMKAPEGATPCESYWNAIQAERAAAVAGGHRSVFVRVVERPEFFRLCESMSPETQRCLPPRYLAANREACLPYRPPAAIIEQLFELRGDLVDPEDLETSVPGGAADAGIPGVKLPAPSAPPPPVSP